jgi:hypothetical protein
MTKKAARKEERWKAIAQEKEVVTFEVRLEDHDSETRTEKLTLTDLADMLTKGGVHTSIQALHQMKIVSPQFPMRFKKTITGKDKFVILIVS